MTDFQKDKILSMRNEGAAYSQIASVIGLSENTVKSFCRRNNMVTVENSDFCPECNSPLVHLPHKKQKKFCSDKCRLAWWAKHPEVLNKKAVYHFNCQNCKKEFTAYGNSNRKHCSRACAIKARSVCNE